MRFFAVGFTDAVFACHGEWFADVFRVVPMTFCNNGCFCGFWIGGYVHYWGMGKGFLCLDGVVVCVRFLLHVDCLH